MSGDTPLPTPNPLSHRTFDLRNMKTSGEYSMLTACQIQWVDLDQQVSTLYQTPQPPVLFYSGGEVPLHWITAVAMAPRSP